MSAETTAGYAKSPEWSQGWQKGSQWGCAQHAQNFGGNNYVGAPTTACCIDWDDYSDISDSDEENPQTEKAAAEASMPTTKAIGQAPRSSSGAVPEPAAEPSPQGNVLVPLLPPSAPPCQLIPVLPPLPPPPSHAPCCFHQGGGDSECSRSEPDSEVSALPPPHTPCILFRGVGGLHSECSRSEPESEVSAPLAHSGTPCILLQRGGELHSECSRSEPEAEVCGQEEELGSSIVDLAFRAQLMWKQVCESSTDHDDVLLYKAVDVGMEACTSIDGPQALGASTCEANFGSDKSIVNCKAQSDIAFASPRGSARQNGRKDSESMDWGRHEAVKLQVSNSSWAAQQRARRGDTSASNKDDAEVVRAIKSILNKLTIEKFNRLYQQLVECGINSGSHVEILIQEVFEKATTQHHFMDMYADLCEMLHEHFSINPVSDDPKYSFKRLLLSECQSSFERNLSPPADLKQIKDFTERSLAENFYKTRMLGNIRFVGALLQRKMLAGKVMVSIGKELLDDPTPEALESLAALLTVVGPTFDTPEWPHRPVLNAILDQLHSIARKATCGVRVRCLLKDLLDMRARGWQDRRPKRCEGPSTLREVAERSGTTRPDAKPQQRSQMLSGQQL